MTLAVQSDRMRRLIRFYATAAIGMQIAMVISVSVAVAQGGSRGAAPVDGKALFAQCSPCHSLAPSHNDRGPTLYHLLGRKSGVVVGYHYSRAMENAAIVWRDDTLTRFLADPQRLVPGTTMIFAGISDPQQIKALMDYLRIAAH